MSKPSVSVLFLIACVLFVSHAEAKPSADEIKTKIRTFTQEMLEASPAAGASVAVLYQGVSVIQEGFGFANLEVNAKADPGNVYELASISKEFTAAAVMRLIEQGKLKLNDDIREYVVLNTGEYVITVKHLLEHSSGLPSFTEFPENRAWTYAHGDKVVAEDILRAVEKRPLLFEPGSKYSYTNTGFFVLALIIEKVTGRKFEDYIKDEVIKKAGLKETFYCDGERLIPRRATPYKLLNAHEFANLSAENRHLNMGYTNICATARDLLSWSTALRTGRIVSTASYDLMTHAGASPRYGLGFQLSELEGHRRIYHTGSDLGVATVLSTYPDLDLTIAVLSNTGQASTERVELRIARLFAGLPDLPRPKDLALSGAEAAKYVGVYLHPRLKILIKYRDGHLIQTVENLPDNEFAVLWNQGGDVFVFKDSEQRLKFDVANGRRASSFAMGDGTNWRDPCPRTKD